MRLLFAFLLQWIATSFGLWIAVRWFGTVEGTHDTNAEIGIFLMAGLILSIINIFIKPIVSIISLPITIVTLGLFTLVINGLMVYIALQLTDDIDMTFFGAILTGIIIGVVNAVIGGVAGAVKAGK